MKPTTISRHKALIRQYHAVCAACGLKADEKETILAGYGVGSSLDLSDGQLVSIIDKLQKEPDQWRKRCMAAVGAWMRGINRTDGAEVVKVIICRAAQYDNFNAIPVSRMQDVYYAFCRKAKATKASLEIKELLISQLELMN